ncbi:MAG: hypothetical protein OEM41_01325, partial [Ignavibacteria bacterium]|nr:hypothetical protein [Ignavibacteria bacterium]
MRLAYPFLLFLTITGSLSAQRLSHPVAVSRDDVSLAVRTMIAVPDTIDVLAVMVQFQQDNDTRTSGNGQFDLSPGAGQIIDPPPRNGQYFEDHLTFLRNYYLKASKGLVVIRAAVLDSVFTLPVVMATYSPPRGGSDSLVANLARDTWTLVNASALVPDFSLYESFVVFHAGVGRDVDLISELGFDPTPFDIPSLYFGLNAFRQYYGEDYQGIPVNGGFITNTSVLPETENRLIPTVSGDILLELGINGLLCASVGSFLGLPDLFNTSTGRSGIGRFGLMDGQSIFSFSGVFPPEPSAWEKYRLGWVEPVIVQPGQTVLSLPAVGLPDSIPGPRIYRVPISTREYFLVENRNRDPLQDGQTVTIRSNGSTRPLAFRRDTAGFNAFDISSLFGNVIDVDDLDWSLPGGVESSGNFFDGGTLVWHVDENIIDLTIAANRVNADPDRRGVDLEEADGSQDIGREFDFLSPGSGSEDGTPLDFWFEGNPSPVNRNEFSPTSFPDSRSSAFANSHITIRGFSPRGPVMQATVILGDDMVKPLPGFPKQTGAVLAGSPLTVTERGAVQEPLVFAATTGVGAANPGTEVNGRLYAWTMDGTSAGFGGMANGLIASAADAAPAQSFRFGPAVADLNTDGVFEVVLPQGSPGSVGTSSEILRGLTLRDLNADSLADLVFQLPVTQTITASPVIGDSTICFGATGGKAYVLRFNGTLLDSFQVSSGTADSVIGVSKFILPDSYVLTSTDGTVSIKTVGGRAPDITRNVGSPISGPAATALFGPDSGDVRVVLATREGLVYMMDGSLAIAPGFPVHTGVNITEPPALGDINGDGYRDITVLGGDMIVALNKAGAALDNFPVTLIGQRFSSSPVLADVNNDGSLDVVGGTSGGLVVAYDAGGKPVSGFPLQTGTGKLSIAVTGRELTPGSF